MLHCFALLDSHPSKLDFPGLPDLKNGLNLPRQEKEAKVVKEKPKWGEPGQGKAKSKAGRDLTQTSASM